MLYLITGGSGSGKSEYAENLAVHMHKTQFSCGKLFYVATMCPYRSSGEIDAECEARIKRHRNMRREKGFSTIECYCGIRRIEARDHDVILVECMSNLLANEMYREEGHIRSKGAEEEEEMREAILSPLLDLGRKIGCVIVVTNEVFSEGTKLPEETERYLGMLGAINRGLAKEADCVTEVVCGIPVTVPGVDLQKGSLECGGHW